MKRTHYQIALLVFGLAWVLVEYRDFLAVEFRYLIAQRNAAAQNEAAVAIPPAEAGQRTEPRHGKRVFFGDTHVHTSLSFDSYLFGNRFGVRDAYRFATGESVELVTGEKIALSRPLDFVVLADHAESFGLFVTCERDDLSRAQREFCARFDTPSRDLFMTLRNEAVQRPPQRNAVLCGDEREDKCRDDAASTWADIRAAANEYYQPGEFTTFIGYEYSPVLPQQGKLHRNVIFKNSQTPARAVSAYDADTVLDLWRALERECTGECEFLTIPHNMNKSWGLAYSGLTIDGAAYQEADWSLRARNEPIAEIFQAKGASECGIGAGASDEECDFERLLPICEDGQQTGCSGVTSFARQGLKKGMTLGESLGFNPLRFGFIGSTDTHNGNPGDTEEYDFRGVSGLFDSPAKSRLDLNAPNRKPSNRSIFRNPGGLAAVWAEENTRDALFEAMQRREVYATSGSRIKLRFYASLDKDGLASHISGASDQAAAIVPMGGVLPVGDATDVPSFYAWAQKDSAGNNLQKIQIIKLWMEEGVSREKVIDIACSDGLSPDVDSGRCPDNRAEVDLASCMSDAASGDAEIDISWVDPEYVEGVESTYYIRVLENPACRWSSYDALRLGLAPADEVPAVIQERAWSSPIWISAQPGESLNK